MVMPARKQRFGRAGAVGPGAAFNHVIEEYRDHLRSEFRARDRALRGAREDELDRPLCLAQEPFYQAHRPFRAGQRWTDLPLDQGLTIAIPESLQDETARPCRHAWAIRIPRQPQAAISRSGFNAPVTLACFVIRASESVLRAVTERVGASASRSERTGMQEQRKQ